MLQKVLFSLFVGTLYAQTFDYQGYPSERVLISTNHEVRVNLVQKNMDKLRQINREVSDPDNAKFGKYLGQQELAKLIGQPKGVTEKIQVWAQSQADEKLCPVFTRVGPHNDYIYVKSCLRNLEKIFNVRFATYTTEKSTVYRTKEEIDGKDLGKLNIPAELQEYIRKVEKVGELPKVLEWQGKKASQNAQFQGLDINPNLIRSNYKIDGYPSINKTGILGPQSRQAVGEFQFNFWYPQDLLDMQDHYNRPENNVSNIVGDMKLTSPYAEFIEGSLDVQYITTVQDIETWGFIEPGFDFDLIDYCQTVASTPGAPLVHSLSYGGTESSLGEDYCLRTSDDFMKMTTMGYTFIAASGDDGTNSQSYFSCPAFTPLFPASSPYVTAVGATYLEQGANNPECTIYFSGSGFSNYFARENYQDKYVEEYFKTENSRLPDSSLYNSSGRAIPDLAAYGTNFQVLIEGYYESVAGTSASCPVVASMVGYSNARRALDGKPALGNINQRLYKSGKVGTDINCGESKANECSQGFYSSVGWDPATGLGTPLGDVFFPLLINN